MIIYKLKSEDAQDITVCNFLRWIVTLAAQEVQSGQEIIEKYQRMYKPLTLAKKL